MIPGDLSENYTGIDLVTIAERVFIGQYVVQRGILFSLLDLIHDLFENVDCGLSIVTSCRFLL